MCEENNLVMFSTLSVLLVLLNTLVGKAGKDELGRTCEICKTYKVLVRKKPL